MGFVEDYSPPALLAPPTQRRNLEANFFSVSRNVVLARSLFIASPPPSRSSISDANSCKLPSSLSASCSTLPRRLLTARPRPPRVRSHTIAPRELVAPLLNRFGINRPSVVKLFREPARNFGDYRYLFAARPKRGAF